MIIIAGYDPLVFQRNLIKYAEQSGRKQIEIAKYLDVSRSVVSGYFSGRVVPRVDKLEKLSILFGVSISDLLEEHDEQPRILRLYSKLNPDNQSKAIDYISYLLSRQD